MDKAVILDPLHTEDALHSFSCLKLQSFASNVLPVAFLDKAYFADHEEHLRGQLELVDELEHLDAQTHSPEGPVKNPHLKHDPFVAFAL